MLLCFHRKVFKYDVVSMKECILSLLLCFIEIRIFDIYIQMLSVYTVI